MTLEALNSLPPVEAALTLGRCCGARAWVSAMLAARPFPDRAAVHAKADQAWWSLAGDDWREAFAQHPRIGDIEALRLRFPATSAWAGAEQAGAYAADVDVLAELARGNRDYEERFGHIFIVCATGLTAHEMLARLHARLGNAAPDELRNAAAEHIKITHLRLDKLLEEER